jgi:hypothetical protein
MQRPERSARGNQAAQANPNPEGVLAVKTSDTIEKVLDRLNDMREELLSIERSIERIEAVKRPNDSEKSFPRQTEKAA